MNLLIEMSGEVLSNRLPRRVVGMISSVQYCTRFYLTVRSSKVSSRVDAVASKSEIESTCMACEEFKSVMHLFSGKIHLREANLDRYHFDGNLGV